MHSHNTENHDYMNDGVDGVYSGGTFGPSFDFKLDLTRIQDQHERIKKLMRAAYLCGPWLSLAEISELTGDPQGSISAQLRHLRKPAFGEEVNGAQASPPPPRW